MLTYGDVQDRRPITPPPCIRLVVIDAATRQELDIKSVALTPCHNLPLAPKTRTTLRTY